MHYIKNHNALALTMLLSLAACGGSDNTKPLALLSTTPANGATETARNVQPTATFDQSLSAASAIDSNVQLLSPLGLPIAADLSVSGAVLNLRPKAGALPGGGTYTLKLSTGLQSTGGSALNSTANIDFTTAAQQWGTSLLVSSPSNAYSPAIAAGAVGNATAVWVQITGAHGMLYASHYESGIWSTPAQVDSDTGTVNFVPAVAMDNAGNATTVWAQSNGTRYGLYASRYSGGSWSKPIEVDDPALTSDVYTPKVVIDAAGNATAIWCHYVSGHFIIYSSRSSNGSAWSKPVQVQAIGDREHMAVATNAAGNMIVVWIQSNGTRYSLYASRSDNGIDWSTPVQVDSISSTGAVWTPAVTMDATGNPTAIWPQDNGTRYLLNASHYRNGSWSTPVQIDSPSATDDPYNAALTVDIAGNVSAVWSQFGSSWHVYNSRYSNGIWSTPFQMDDASASNDADDSSVAVDAAGNVIVLWRQTQTGSSSINARRLE